MSLRRIAGNFRTKIVQAERKSKRSLRFCRGAAYLSGACSRKACKPSAKANEVCGFAEAPPVWAGLRPARSAVRLSGTPEWRARYERSRSARNAVGAGVRLLSLVVSSVPGRRCAARRLFFCEFSVFFLRFWKKELLLHSGKSYTTSSCRIPQARN